MLTETDVWNIARCVVSDALTFREKIENREGFFNAAAMSSETRQKVQAEIDASFLPKPCNGQSTVADIAKNLGDFWSLITKETENANLREQIEKLTRERDEARAELGIFRSRLSAFVEQQFEESP